ncbi:hypothetical protein ABFG93_00395 [Pseudalkalibacillus hwajinpoensis]|uniref:hypothetical protein n=1 Tax=Guptibacillus hwajinpoensis TaxID=208199 RepID=UPI00325A91A0
MSSYPYKHSEGSLIYKVETYRFRYQGVTAADIKLIDVPGENFMFEFEIEKDDKHWPELPHTFHESSSNDPDLQQEIGMEPNGGGFETKEEALQTAINMIESLLNKYRKQGVFWEDIKKNLSK